MNVVDAPAKALNSKLKSVKLVDSPPDVKSERRKWMLLLRNLYANIIVFFKYLIPCEAIFSILSCVALTLVIYYTMEKSYFGSMDWVILGFAVVTPTSMSISFAFKRRELALRSLTDLKSTMLQIFIAHASWDWNAGAGRKSHSDKEKWIEHADAVLTCLLNIGDELVRYLTLPCSSRAQHRVTTAGRKDALQTICISYDLFNSIAVDRIYELSQYTEKMKVNGMNPSEASRIRQYERYVSNMIEDLRIKKNYRTPQALRSFSRLFSMFLPIFYTPAYAKLAKDSHLSIGIIFSILVPLALTALAASVNFLEDPFISSMTLDGVDVREELVVLSYQQLIRMRSKVFPFSPDFIEINSNKDTIQICTGRQSSFYTSIQKEGMDKEGSSSRKSRFNYVFSTTRNFNTPADNLSC